MNARAQEDKSAEPNAGEQEKALKLIHEVYKDDYQKRGPDERRKLGARLLEEAKTTKETTTQYTLLKEARNIGMQLGDFELAMGASEWMGKLFTLSGPDQKLKALDKMKPLMKTPEANQAGIEAAQIIVEQAIEAEEFTVALQALDQLKTYASAAKNIQIASTVEAKKAELQIQATAFNEYKNGLERLKIDPNAAQAKYQVGLYLCVFRQDWDKGLALTSAGADSAWMAASKADLTAPVQLTDMMKVADGWFDLGASRSAFRGRIWVRAEFWYTLVLPMCDGVLKAKVEKRLEQIGKERPVTLANVSDATKKALPTEAEMRKLKELSAAARSSTGTAAKKAMDELNKYQQGLLKRLEKELLDGKETDFFARCKAEIQIRKILEASGVGSINNNYSYLHNRFNQFAGMARSKDELADRLLSLERYNQQEKAMDTKTMDALVLNAIKQFAIANQSTYVTPKARLELAAFMKDRGITSKGVDQYKAIVEPVPPPKG